MEGLWRLLSHTCAMLDTNIPLCSTEPPTDNTRGGCHAGATGQDRLGDVQPCLWIRGGCARHDPRAALARPGDARVDPRRPVFENLAPGYGLQRFRAGRALPD